MLRIKAQDIRRATLPLQSGNEGWIGVSPHGDLYHVVVPVDVQIARGVMACNRPADGTPFGGYSNWLYFRCPPYEDQGNEAAAREERIRQTGRELILYLNAYEIEAEIEADDRQVERTGPTATCGSTRKIAKSGTDEWENVVPTRGGTRNRGSGTRAGRSATQWQGTSCPHCSRRWETLSQFIRDPAVILDRYRACPDDFGKGSFVFVHSCGGRVEIDASTFARASRKEKSLMGTHACPGMCYYETSFRSCSAACEGSPYRRIVQRLKCKP